MSPKVALVSGSSTGIGLATVKALLESGFATVMTAPDSTQGKKVFESLKEKYANLHFYPLGCYG